MKRKIPLIGRFLLGLLVAAALTFGTVEVVRGSGEVRSTCTDCHLEDDPDGFCSGPACCNEPGSMCLGPPLGDCLCA